MRLKLNFPRSVDRELPVSDQPLNPAMVTSDNRSTGIFRHEAPIAAQKAPKDAGLFSRAVDFGRDHVDLFEIKDRRTERLQADPRRNVARRNTKRRI